MTVSPISNPSSDDIARVVARDEIRQLAFRYAWFLDSRDVGALAGLFVEDVQVGPRSAPQVFAASTNRELLAATLSEQLRKLGPTTLFVGNHIIDFDDSKDGSEHADQATGIVYCRGYIHDPSGFIEQMIVYFDKYRRCDDGAWRFVSRRHELFYGVVTAEQPQTLTAANWPEHQTGTGTLPFRLESWQAFHHP